MKLIVFALLIMTFGSALTFGQAQNSTDNADDESSYMEPIKITTIPVSVPTIPEPQMQLVSIPCTSALPVTDVSCDSNNLYAEEFSTSIFKNWTKLTWKERLAQRKYSDYQIKTGDFGIVGPGSKSAFCKGCFSGITKKAIEGSAAAVTDEYFNKQIGEGFLDKQTSDWAERFHAIQENIKHLKLTETDAIKLAEIDAAASECAPNKIDAAIDSFFKSQAKAADNNGYSSCMSLNKTDRSFVRRVFTNSKKLKTEREKSYREILNARTEAIKTKIKNQKTLSCLNEGLLEKASGDFSLSRFFKDLRTKTPDEQSKISEDDLREFILQDPKYSFMLRDKNLTKVLNQFISDSFIVIKDGITSSLATTSPEALAEKLDVVYTKFDKLTVDFDKKNKTKSVNNLASECKDLMDKHLEAVLCNTPDPSDLTDLEVVPRLELGTNKLDDCIEHSDYNTDGIKKLTPFCAKYLTTYCNMTPTTHKKGSEKLKYRTELAAVDAVNKQVKLYANDKDETKVAKADLEDKYCPKMKEKCIKDHPGVDVKSAEFEKFLEDMTLADILKNSESDPLLKNNSIIKQIVSYKNAEISRIAESTGTAEDKNQNAKANMDAFLGIYASTAPEEGSTNETGSGNDSNSGNNFRKASSGDDDGGGGKSADTPEDSPVYIAAKNAAGDGIVSDSEAVSESDGSKTKTVIEQNSNSGNQGNSFSNSNNSYTPTTTYRAPEVIKKDEQTVVENKEKIDELKKQLIDNKAKNASQGTNYKKDPDYIANEKKLKELEDKTKELEAKLLAEKDQRIKELEKIIASKKEGDKDSDKYKKLYEELKQLQESRTTVANNPTSSTSSNFPTVNNQTQNTSTSSNSGSTTSTNNTGTSSSSGTSYVNGIASNGASANGGNNAGGSTGGFSSYVATQSTKPSNDIPVITLTAEEFKLINQNNPEKVKEAVQEIIKKHNGSITGNYLYVQSKNDRGEIVYQSIDLKILKVPGDDKKITKKDDKKDDKKDKKRRVPSATVSELEDVLNN